MVLYWEIIPNNCSGLEVKSGQRSSRHDQKEIRLCRVYDNHISCVRLPVWKPRTIREIFFSRNYWTEDCRPILCSCATSTPDGDLVPGTHRNVGIRRESNSDLTKTHSSTDYSLCRRGSECSVFRCSGDSHSETGSGGGITWLLPSVKSSHSVPAWFLYCWVRQRTGWNCGDF